MLKIYAQQSLNSFSISLKKQDLYLSELHLIHTLSSVPMQESFTPEHSGKLFANAFEQFLDGCAVADEGRGHFQSTGRDITDSGLHVVGDPFHKVGAVLVLHVQHLLINFLHGHTATEHGRNRQVSSVPWITGSHHVFRIKHLLGKLWYCECTVLLGSSAGERSKSRHEEVKTRERNHVHCQLPEISIQLKYNRSKISFETYVASVPISF